MAPKRPSPLEEPPTASSSEEELSDVESEEDEEESEVEEEKTQHKKATPVVDDKKGSKNPETQPQFSSDSSESESESDSDHPPRGVADPKIKPIAFKPMDDASKLKNPRSSKSTAPAAATPAKSVAKRPVENSGAEEKDSKRAKKKVQEADGGGVVETEKEKRPLFQRFWSEEYEIVLLKGMLDYASKKGTDPIVHLTAFHDFVKELLPIDFTRLQLQEKMKRLKKKYENNAGKGKKGEDRTFSKPHDQKAFDLSKKIWGSEAIAKRSQKNDKRMTPDEKELMSLRGPPTKKDTDEQNLDPSQNNNKRMTPGEKERLLASIQGPKDAPSKKDTEEQNSDPSQVSKESILFGKSIVASGLDESFMKEGLGLIDSAKKSELEEKWRKLQVAEAEIFLRRIELVREQTKLVLNAYKKH